MTSYFTPKNIHLMQKGADLHGEVDGFKIRLSMPNQYHTHCIFIDETRFSLNNHDTLKEALEKTDQYLELAKNQVLPEIPLWQRSAVEWANILTNKDQASFEAATKFAQFKEGGMIQEQEYLEYASLKRATYVRHCQVYQEFCDAMNRYPKLAKFRWYSDEIEKLPEVFLYSLHALEVQKSGHFIRSMESTNHGLSHFARAALARKILAKYLSERLLNLERVPVEALRVGDVIESNSAAVLIERVTGKVRKQAYGRKLDRYNRPEGEALKIAKHSTGYKLVNEIMPMVKRFNTLAQYAI